MRCRAQSLPLSCSSASCRRASFNACGGGGRGGGEQGASKGQPWATKGVRLASLCWTGKAGKEGLEQPPPTPATPRVTAPLPSPPTSPPKANTNTYYPLTAASPHTTLHTPAQHTCKNATSMAPLMSARRPRRARGLQQCGVVWCGVWCVMWAAVGWGVGCSGVARSYSNAVRCVDGNR